LIQILSDYNNYMSVDINPKFEIRCTPEAEVRSGRSDSGYHLELLRGSRENYRLAQLDDYNGLQRKHFPWQLPIELKLRARVSAVEIPGTWGFGLWNDPFSLSLGFGGGSRRFPILPNAAWFFFASSQNYLSFQDDKPAQGFLAQAFRSSQIPTPLLTLGAFAFPLLLWPWLARKLRPLFSRVIKEDSFALDVDVTQWHEYYLAWNVDNVIFRVDDQTINSAITPSGPLGLVIWIDNQFAAFPPNGRLSYGTLTNPKSAWLEIEALTMETVSPKCV
jgi:hypothetical protein